MIYANNWSQIVGNPLQSSLTGMPRRCVPSARTAVRRMPLALAMCRA